MIQGISHITILVRDLDKTSRLLCDGLGAEEIYDSQDRHFSISREKYFLLGGIWLVAMQGAASEKSYRHIAFQVEKRHLTAYQTRLTALGATIVPSRSRVEGEGASVYFYDYDNNLFELHAGSLEERLERYKR
ncbi:MAG: FosX/FosE/FosI family fosfomycin resistance hydrolase [Desulfobacterales bacterium]|nr:FosX/FosE/FosI family fosfomycin resistance hydrolase [Desulfobacterales bacterium]MDJ0990159.1 FosX/FosE/FosI family fosfomycin resistance hydrolase [Desulfobacterales bacterium]